MENLYMFAIVPPKELEERIQKERIQFSENYSCVKALKPPVHITIYEPFKQDEVFEEKVNGLQKWADKQLPFQVELDNYDFFENPVSPVAFIKVARSKRIVSLHTELLVELKKYLKEQETSYLPNNKPIPKQKPKPYNPHITIGYRDVPAEKLPDIKRDYARRTFKGSFLCDQIRLWKHNGKNWETDTIFKLNGGTALLTSPTLF